MSLQTILALIVWSEILGGVPGTIWVIGTRPLRSFPLRSA
jgi:hypothetical protein